MKKNTFLTMALVLLNFALWGVVNNMSDNLVPAFQRIFSMDQDRAVLVQVSFYGAYAVLALFTSILVEEFSFRTGILIGLGTYVIGALLYIPACIAQSFDYYFIGIFVVAGGCAILEASSNPCVLAIGDPKSAVRRLNFAQAINPVGSIVGIFLAQKVILAHLNPATVEERLAMAPDVLKGIIHRELVWICVPYVGLCVLLLAIWFYFLRHPIHTEVEATAQKGPLGRRVLHVVGAALLTAVPFAVTGWLFPNMDKLCWMLTGMIGPFVCILLMKAYRASFLALVRTPRYVCGLVALFAYVGMQIAVWTWMNAYGQKELGISPETSANYYILAIAIHILNCWGGTYAMKWIAPWKIMATYCLLGIGCCLGTIYLPSDVLFTAGGVPFSANILCLMGISLFMAILFPTIYGIALGGLDPKCFKLGGPGMIMAILGGAVITPWMASVISAKESVFFALVPMMDFTWDANLRTSSAALRASFFVPIICFVVMFAYAVFFGPSKGRALRKTLLILFAAAGTVWAPPLGAETLEEGFRAPPMSARPQTWWHWMNGNVSKEGITADLVAMREVGLGGATLFDAGCGVPSGSLKFASPEWYDHVKHAAAEARRLGLELCLPNCSGWSSSGGPWNPAANNMKELVRTERRYAGPRHVREKLPPLPNAHGFAADIAVLAVPVPPAEQLTMEKAGGVVTAPSQYVREIAFPAPFAADGVFFWLEHDWLWEVGGDVKVETSDDGKSYAELMTADATLALRAGWDRTERYRPFPREVKARFYRLTFSFRVIGLDAGDHERVRKTVVASVRVGRAKSLSCLCDKTFAKRIPVTVDPDTAKPDQVVAKEAVRVLTLSADGTLDWEVPPGDWRVIRLGFAANGKKNHPASDFGGGFEVDKLSPSALDYHFEQYAAKLVRHLGPLAGDVPSGLTGILVDSYEIGSQNWTQGFEDEFRKRRGYDLTPYLPVLTGVVVGSVDESERFLADFRRTVADLFVDGYSGALAKKCHRYGLKLWLEPYGNCPCDDLEYGDEADVPMCEFWSQAAAGNRCVETGNARFPGSLAHVWGCRYVGAEAFTSAPPSGGRWTTTPFALKAQGDRAFAKGVNRLIFHRFCHQPFVKGGAFAAPGFTLGPYGIHLDRTQTWWRQARPYMDYLARCQWMLQEGRNVADVLFWHGEEVPSRGGHIVGIPEDYSDCPVPDGFAKDVCSTKALKALTVADGKVVAPGGARYEMLVLQDVTEMSSATLEAIGRLVDAGATVVAPRRPEKVIGLWRYPDGDAEIRSRAAAIWAKGVVTGAAAEGIRARRLAPDVRLLSCDGVPTNGFAWIHRRYEDGTDAYFAACPNERTADVTCSFRADGREPELWDAESGTVGLAPKRWRRVGDRTEVTFALPPSGSAFVVFRRPTDRLSGGAPAPAPAPEVRTLTSAWHVTFPIGWYAGGPEAKTVEMIRLVDWTTFADDDLRYFSGTATYETTVAGETAKAAGRRVWLDLGDVKNFADVTVNGRSYPTLWRPPFRVDVTDALQAGDNRVTIRITNLWPNRMIGDERLCAPDCEWTEGGALKEIPAFIREGRPSPTGRKTFATWRHWKKDDALLPSGLLGPVKLVVR